MVKKDFSCYSRNLTNFLKKEGIFPKEEGVHTTGLSISSDGGKTWKSYTSPTKALDDFYRLFSNEEITSFRDEAFKTGNVVSTGRFVEDENGALKEVLVKKRIRYYKVFEVDDRLGVALNRWNKSKPSWN